MTFYTDNSGVQHESYEAACVYYGADTPSSLAAEDAYQAARYREDLMDGMMAGRIQEGVIWADVAFQRLGYMPCGDNWDELPF